MPDHFKRSLYAAIVLILLLASHSAAAFGTRAMGHAQAHAAKRGRHHRDARNGRHKPGAFVLPAEPRGVAVATAVLLGDSAVEWRHDSLAPGRAEAFRLRASRSGVAAAIHVYVSAKSSASGLTAGLYSSASNRPGALLSTGSTYAIEPGAWSTVSIAPVELVAGRIYWLAILGHGGRLRYRDRARGRCPSDTSASDDLRALPGSWRIGTTYSDCPASAYVTPALLPPSLTGSPALPSVLTQATAVFEEAADLAASPAGIDAPANTALPAVSGVADEGQTLTASEGSWTGSPTSYGYQWEDCDTAGEACSSVGGATSSTYRLVSGDVGHTVRVVVTARNEDGSTEASSEATATVVALAPTIKVRPKLSGVAEEGQKLTASEGSWTGNPTSYGYQWEDCNAAGEKCSSIAGAASSTYGLVASDVGHTVAVVVTAKNGGGSGKASSEATVIVVAAGSAGSQVYVSQSGAGGEAGTSCVAAHRLRWLDEESHWGSGSSQVGPGTVVHLCGTLTEPVETKGSGSAGNPIEVRFEAGAKIAMGGSGCPGSGCINVGDAPEYVTINGGVDGQIENTERSYAREKEEGPVTTGIEANGCRHCNFENLEVGPLYDTEKGDVVGNTEIRGIKIRPEGGNVEYVTVAHDYFHDQGWSVNIEADPSTNHIYVEHDVFYRLTHGFTPGASFNGGDIGPVVFAHNDFYGNINWEDGEHDTNHVDGVHCFAGYGDYPHYNSEPGKGLYIYDNYFTMEGHNAEAPVFLEGANNHTVCGDKTSPLWVFDNVITGTTANGLITDGSGEPRIFNNTFIGTTTEKEACVEITSDTESGRELAIQNVRFKNNVASTCATLIDGQKQLLASSGFAYNLWANGSAGGALECRTEQGNAGEHGALYSLAEFSTWKSCMEQGEEHSITTSSAKLDLTEDEGVLGKPEAGSQAIGHGANLTSLCAETPEEALCKGIDGEERPSTGAWNIGAY